MAHALNRLIEMLEREPAAERPIPLQITCSDDLPRILALLPPALAASGGWLLRLTPATPVSCTALCELERSALLDLYVELANLGLSLSEESAHVLTQAWRAGHSHPDCFDSLTVELRLRSLAGEAVAVGAAA